MNVWRSSSTGVLYAIAAFAPGGLCGCSGDAGRVPVSGVVTVDSEPLRKTTFFVTPVRNGDSIETAPMLVGVTDDQGRYSLVEARYPDRKGGLPGEYVISWELVSDPNFVATGAADESEPPARYPVPKRYRKIEFEIPPGGSDSADLIMTTE